MRDRVYFYLDISMPNEVDEVILYYNLNDERKDVIKQNTLSSIRFVDYYGYEEYISFKNFDKIINNMYVEVKLRNGITKTYKLNFDREYANVDFFLKEGKTINDGDSVNKDNSINNLNKGINDVINRIKGNGGVISLVYEDIEYKFSYRNAGLKITFMVDNFQESIIYESDNYDYFYYEVYENKEWYKQYGMNLSTGECIQGNCNEFNRHYDKFIELMNYLVNNDF